MKRIGLLIVVTALIAALVYFLQLSSNGRVAKVFGKDILMSDLDLTEDELKSAKQSYPKLSDEEVLAQARSKKLSRLIWTPIMDEFAKHHDVEPTDEEIQGFAEATKVDLPPKYAGKFPELSAEQAREINAPFVKNWKISKALYEEFGGTVIFQQSNPLEPVGAYRKLLESHEAKGDFKIYDEKLKELFWDYYVREHSFQVPEHEIDYSTPWWLKKQS
jgi:hypothetical protein